MKNFTCLISKQKMLQPSNSQSLQLPWAVHPKGTQEGEKQVTAPRWLRCISKEWFSWAQTFTSSHTQKSAKFITWRYLVSFIFWCFNYLVFVANTLLYAVPPLPLGGNPSEQSKKLSSGLTPPPKKKKIHEVKHNSQLLGGAIFFDQQFGDDTELQRTGS